MWYIFAFDHVNKIEIEAIREVGSKENKHCSEQFIGQTKKKQQHTHPLDYVIYGMHAYDINSSSSISGG